MFGGLKKNRTFASALINDLLTLRQALNKDVKNYFMRL